MESPCCWLPSSSILSIFCRSEHCVRPSCRLAAPSHPARSPEQGDVRPVPVPDLPPLRPALAGVRRGGLLRHRLGHFHRRDEAHFLCPRRRDHPAHRPAWKLQRKTSDIMRLFLLCLFCTFLLVSNRSALFLLPCVVCFSLAHYFCSVCFFVACDGCTERGKCVMLLTLDLNVTGGWCHYGHYGNTFHDIVLNVECTDTHAACPLNQMKTSYCSSDIKIK